MKRFWTTEKYRLQQARRSRKEALRRRPRRGQVYSRGSGGEVQLTAPTELSLFDHPGETLVFCNDLRAATGRNNTRVMLDLSGVTRFSSDALFLMRAIMDAGKGWHTNVGGNLPSNGEVAAKIKATGFFAGFARPPGKLPDAKGLILRKSQRRVFSEIAADLVRFAQSNASISREVANACSHTLVEAMTNTHGHAGTLKRRRGKPIPQAWSAGVYCEEGAAHFTFVDLGVGIFRSAPARGYLQGLKEQLNVYGKPRLLRDAFNGVIGSSTGLPGRGLGLPRMKADADAGLLPNLQVLTSDVIGGVAELNFSTLAESMRGTVLRWKAGEERVS